MIAPARCLWWTAALAFPSSPASHALRAYRHRASRLFASAAMAEEYDLVTLGAGSGGTRASRFAAQYYGKKVACVELPFGFVSSDKIGGAGGTCVIRGCVPKKLLVYASAFRDEFDDAVGFGWTAARPPHEWKKLIASKAKEIERLNSVYVNLLKGAGVEYIEGKGVLKDAHTVEVEGADGSKRTLRAKNILVATGGYATKIDIPGAEHAITSDEALALDALPGKSVLIIGSGYIAVEFAGIFNGLGAETHLMFRATSPLRGFDEECRAQVADNLGKRGVIMHAGELPTKIEKLGQDYYRVTCRQSASGEERTIDVGLVMMATGRKPRSNVIGLEGLGVAMDGHGAVKVDDYSRTNVEGVYAIGDVTNRINLTPVALMEAPSSASRRWPPSGTPRRKPWRSWPAPWTCSPASSAP
ncbi:MAG: hypothetical protein J3K34DRAFT_189860 [Monoraphidium minutum]|nr:MAG: hypothetical protein J3K34DRAFT_189860 [Monoraphidium minutum]